MSNIITNLKVKFGADTSNFKKGTKEGEQAVQEFKEKGSSAFNDFAKAFGVNIDAISQQTEIFTSGLKAMQAGLKGSAETSGVLTKALKLLKVAMVSTGIGALVVALGSLLSYFTKTKEGSDKLKQAMDAIGAVFSVIVDRASALGKSIVEAFQNPKEAVSDLWEFIKSQFVNRVAAIPKLIESAWKIVKGIFDGTAKEAAADFASAMTQLGTGLDEEQQKKVANGIKGVVTEVKNEAKAAADLRKQLQALEDEEIRLIEINSEREKQIEELRNKSKELRYKDIEESKKALQQAMNIEQARLDDELRIARERAKIIEQQKALGNNLREDDKELAEAKARVNELERQSLAYRRRMISEMQTLTREYEAQQEAIRKTEMALYDEIEAVGKLSPAGTEVDTSKLALKLAPIPPLDTSLLDESVEGIKSTFIDLGGMINDTLVDLTTGFAETFGALLAGSGTLQDFGSFVLSTLGDLAISVGKIAISTGIAIEGIKDALLSLNPAVAIAAGVALIALGSMVKNSLASAASGGSSSYSSSATSGTQTFDTTATSTYSNSREPVYVRVTGEFKQKGSDLVAVINETNYKKNLRT